MPKQTFEKAMKQLEGIVEELETGELGLDDALKKFQEGMKLSRFCSEKLDKSEKTVSLLLKDESGNLQEKPFSGDGFEPQYDDEAGK
jgi:exodeoxyribonuclease VII small subunit